MIDKISEYTSDLKEFAKGLTKGVNNVMNGRDFDDNNVQATDQQLFIFNENGDPIIKANEDLVNNPKNLIMTAQKAEKMYKLKEVYKNA